MYKLLNWYNLPQRDWLLFLYASSFMNLTVPWDVDDLERVHCATMVRAVLCNQDLVRQILSKY